MLMAMILGTITINVITSHLYEDEDEDSNNSNNDENNHNNDGEDNNDINRTINSCNDKVDNNNDDENKPENSATIIKASIKLSPLSVLLPPVLSCLNLEQQTAEDDKIMDEKHAEPSQPQLQLPQSNSPPSRPSRFEWSPVQLLSIPLPLSSSLPTLQPLESTEQNSNEEIINKDLKCSQLEEEKATEEEDEFEVDPQSLKSILEFDDHIPKVIFDFVGCRYE